MYGKTHLDNREKAAVVIFPASLWGRRGRLKHLTAESPLPQGCFKQHDGKQEEQGEQGRQGKQSIDDRFAY